MSELVTVGWREWVSLPDLGIKWIKAKVDTGACSSSIHAQNVETFSRDGKDFVRFDVFPHQRDDLKVVHVETEVLTFRSVRSSNGMVSVRPVIATRLFVAGKFITAELNLACRKKMGFRMLLGRKALKDDFLVDCRYSWLGGKPERKSSHKRKRRGQRRSLEPRRNGGATQASELDPMRVQNDGASQEDR